jgi:hypothetical protein
MTWLTWRQHRAMVGGFAVFFALVAGYFLLAGAGLHDAYDGSGLAGCVGVLNNPNCGARIADFLSFDVGAGQYLGPLLGLATGGLGAFLGAPLVASELERGTYQWVWTQRVSRRRWLAVKTAVLVATIVGLSVALAYAFAWWDGPVASLTGPFGKEGAFDNTPLLLSAYAVFAFALGLAASTLVRRTVAAIAIALLVFIAVHLTLSFGLRPHYLAPLTIDSPPTAAGPPVGVDERDYHWRSNYLDARGNVISQQEVNRLADPSINPEAAGSDYVTVLRRHGIHSTIKLQPYQRAPLFQLIEAGVLAALTVAAGATAFWRVGRR